MVKEGEHERQGGRSCRLCPPWLCVHPGSLVLPSNSQLERPMLREAEEGDLWDEALEKGELLDEPV